MHKMKRLCRQWDIFGVGSAVALLFVLAPLATIALYLFSPPSDAWAHVREHLLRRSVVNTALLIFSVAALSGVIGLLGAYATSRYEFFGRKKLSWMLILPLGVPSYIVAYMYADMFSHTGSATRFLRRFGIEHSLEVMSLPGATFVFVITLFPYVYLLVQSALKRQSASFLESAKLLGASPVRRFFTVVLPLLRPALVAGTLLVVLETLSDYGVVSYFNVRVLSLSIFDAWFRLGDVDAAVRISAVMLLLVCAVIFVERFLRGRRRYGFNASPRPIPRVKPSKAKRIAISLSLWLFFGIAFLVPLGQLLYYAYLSYDGALGMNTLYLVVNTLSLALASTLLTVLVALILANFARGRSGNAKRAFLKLSTLGYAVPGAVLAIAVMLVSLRLDGWLHPLYRFASSESGRLILTGSLLMLGFAFLVRFMAIAFNAIEASYDKVGDSYTEASRTLGVSKLKTLVKVDLPLIRFGLISAFIIVFIDILKELPITLILSPSNYETLASQVHRYAREEMLQESSVPSLIIIAISSVMIYFLTHMKKEGVPNVR